MTDIAGRFRAEENDTSVAIPCTVTGFDLTGDPVVSVRPQTVVPHDLFDGEVDATAPLDIDEVPYCYPSGTSFALFIPPEVGMQGYMIVTDTEIGDVAGGVAESARRKDRRSGFFVPSGNLTGSPFKGNADWAELRTLGCRIAASRDTVHVEAGATSLVVSPGGFDVSINGVSLIDALRQMSQHIALLEALIHPNGYTHGGVHPRLVDTFAAIAPPTRGEAGVR